MLKITLLPDGEGFAGYELGNNALSRGPGTKDINNLLPELDAMVRARHGLRAAGVEPLVQKKDTYVESTQLTPEIEYGFASEDDKAAFILGLRQNVPPVATVEFIAGSTRWFLIRAKLRPISVVQEWEVAIRLRFTISGGQLVNSLPAA